MERLLRRRDQQDVRERLQIGVDETVETLRDGIGSALHGPLAPIAEIAKLDAVDQVLSADLRPRDGLFDPFREGQQQRAETVL